MPPKAKTMFELDSPYADVPLPQLSPADRDTILNLLTSFLSPIGHYRITHITPSKGKRNKKAKRRELRSGAAQRAQDEALVPPPELSSHILVGLNSITRHLEAQSRKACPPSLGMPIPISDSPGRHLAVVVTTWPSVPPILTSHLHKLLQTSSLLHPNLPPTRLAILPRSSEKRLCSALGVPRAGFIGIFDSAPHATAVIDFCLANVPDLEVGEWLRAEQRGFMPLKINTIEAADSVLPSKV
ncbi:RNase P and RNase MRP subunit [Pseudogymnoascus australis]